MFKIVIIFIFMGGTQTATTATLAANKVTSNKAIRNALAGLTSER
jgi:hypothetical protein